MPHCAATTYENSVTQTVFFAGPRTAADLPGNGRSALQCPIFMGAAKPLRYAV
jgi:hypothetical protein